MSESYTFQRRRIFRRRGSWPSRTGFAFFIFLGAVFGYLLPELVSGAGSRTPSFGEPAFGQIGNASPTDIAASICDRPRLVGGDLVDCTGMRIRLAGIIAPATPGQCKIGGACMIASTGPGLEPESIAWLAGMVDLSSDRP